MRGHITPVWNQIHRSLELVERHDYDSAEWLCDPNAYRGLVGVDHRSLNDKEVEIFLNKDSPLTELLIDPRVALHRLRPSWIIPEHKDLYRRYREHHNQISIEDIIRIIVFLEDWQSGHILQIGNELIAPWKAGDFVSWMGDTPHIAANLGSSDRYTLQITGISQYDRIW